MKNQTISTSTKMQATLSLIQQVILTIMGLVGVYVLFDNIITQIFMSLFFVSIFKEQYVLWRRVCKLSSIYLITNSDEDNIEIRKNEETK